MRQIASIQGLRALAALMVVIGHTQTEAFVGAAKHDVAFTPLPLLPWGAGVDLFFVISGFIMVVSSESLFAQPGASLTFATRRLKRIVPLYWLFTALYVLIQVAMHKAVGSGDLLASLLFWPRDIHGDGILRPVFALGWTLNYEMFFYCVFSLAIILPRRAACIGVITMLAAGVVAGQILTLPPGPLAFWTQPIVLEFTLGMGIAFLWREGVRLSLSLRLFLALIGLAALGFDTMGSAQHAVGWTTPTDLHRLVGWGLPAAMLVAAGAFARETGQRFVSAKIVTLGDASYALYLAHPFVVLSLTRLYAMGGLPERIGYWPYIALSLVLAVASALAVHRWFEVPLARRLALRSLDRRLVTVAR